MGVIMYRVKNWEQWQSYRKDRGQPPWIKIHRCVMRNPEWVSLTDAERGQIVSIWLLAADKNGELPPEKSIAKLCFFSSPLNLNKFIELGFVETYGLQDDASVTSQRRHDDANMTHQSRVEKSRVEKSREDKSIPPSLESVTEYCKERGGKVTPERWYDHYSANGWMCGKNKMKDWRAAVRKWETSEFNKTPAEPERKVII